MHHNKPSRLTVLQLFCLSAFYLPDGVFILRPENIKELKFQIVFGTLLLLMKKQLQAACCWLKSSISSSEGGSYYN